MNFNLPDPQRVLDLWRRADDAAVCRALSRSRRTPLDLPALLSDAADNHLERMAEMARELCLKKFGRTLQLYIPLYLSNACENACLYCGFSRRNRFPRTTSTLNEVEAQLEVIHATGMRHLLLVSGEARRVVPVSYLADSCRIARRRFPSVSVEIYPMDAEDYSTVVEAGAEGLVLYQETYDRDLYATVHPAGPKRDYDFRLQAPSRGAAAGFRKLGLGVLLGLGHHVWEATALLTHLAALRRRWWQVFYTVSYPRLRASESGFVPANPVSDRQLVKLILATRLIFDDVGVVVSTRESAALRDNLIPLGVTQFSAGSRTEPGGYLGSCDLKQFEIEDGRSPREVAAVITARGYDPVWKDWDREMG